LVPLADPKGDDRQITEKVNEMAVAKVLLEDEGITWPITYEPDLLPDGRKIDFVVDRGADNLYIEVKTVRPRTADTEAAWQKFTSNVSLESAASFEQSYHQLTLLLH